MRKLFLPLSSMIAVLAGGAVAAAAEDGNWKEYVYPGDDFAISAPAEPSLEKRTIHAAGGDSEAHVYAMPAGKNGAFMIVVNSRSDSDRRTDQEVLDEARVGVLREANAMVLVQSNVSLGRYRGAQLELESTEPGGKNKRVSDRFFVVGRKLYQLMALATPGYALPPDTERWLDSFRLVGKEGQ